MNSRSILHKMQCEHDAIQFSRTVTSLEKLGVTASNNRNNYSTEVPYMCFRSVVHMVLYLQVNNHLVPG
jgi:hypothetical protein